MESQYSAVINKFNLKSGEPFQTPILKKMNSFIAFGFGTWFILKISAAYCIVQNKKAAIRYRKRQKELKEEAELELTILVNKNNQLKYEIKQMQAEIDQLKARVLKRTSERAQSFRKI